MKPALADELNHVAMRHGRRLVEQDVVGQQLLSTAGVADEKLAKNEVMAAHFAPAQKCIQGGARTAADSTGTESRQTCRRGPSGR